MMSFEIMALPITKISDPRPPFKTSLLTFPELKILSFPSPPKRMSLPLFPIIISSPLPPSIISLPAVPSIVSFPSEPRIMPSSILKLRFTEVEFPL